MFNPLTKAQVSFEFLKEIGGDGKNSQTFTAHDVQLDAEIVIKKILKADIVDKGAFFAESRALYASAHPNVVQIHYACEDVDHVYVAMPLYRNGSVKGLMRAGFLTVREIVHVGCQVLTGLHNVHSKGLVHFDIKSDNVLLSERHEALISDFGLAKPLKNGYATPDLAYHRNAPPESLQTADHDARYDIYQTGLMLYAMCVGLEAYNAQFDAYFGYDEAMDAVRFATDIATGAYPDRKAFPPHIPARLQKVVKRCIDPDREKRYPTALEAMNELAKVEGVELDWRFSEANGERVWQKTVNDSTYVFTVYSDSSSKLTKAVSGGVPRKQSAGCQDRVTPKDIAKILGSN